MRVGPTEPKPTHHIKLTDSSGTELGLITTDSFGDRIPAISVNPYPTMASQLRQGKGKYADRIPPFQDIDMSDFSGGMFKLHYDEDSSGYYDGHRIDTSKEGRVVLGPKETYTTGIRDFYENNWPDPGIIHWATIYSGTTSYTTSFTNSGNWNADKVLLHLKKVGSPTGNVTAYLLSAADAVLQSATYPVTSLDLEQAIIPFDWTGTQALTDGTTYKIKIEYTGGDASNYVMVCTDNSFNISFRILDDTPPFNVIPFEYRGGLYVVTQPEDKSNSKLYQLGTHGLCTGFTASQLTVAGTDFSSSGYDVEDGDLIKIVAGPGSEEDQPWRRASGAGLNGSIPVSPDWNITHTANTEYVVITDKWELLDSLDFYCTDVNITDRTIHLGGGTDDYHHRMRFGNDDGTWTFEGEIGVSEVEETWRADKILSIRKDGYSWERPVYDLYISRKMVNSGDLNYLNNIMKMRTPTFWGSPYFYVGHLTDNTPWLKNEYTNVDIYADRGWCAIEWNDTFTTGNIAAKTLDPPVDFKDAEVILFSMYSDTALNAGDLTLTLGDGSDEWTLDLPAISAGDDMNDNIYWYEIPLHALATAPTGSDFPDLTKIDRIILKVAVDKNANIKIKIGQDGLILATRNPNNERYELGLTEYVNNMVEYGGGAGQVSRKVWVGTNKNVYYIENGKLKPIYLAEVEKLENNRNCELMGVNDVYLYFNLGTRLERYYSGKLDNIGPDAESGLPYTRTGVPCSLASYPGRIYVAFDGGDAISSVLFRKNHGWHEAYRAPYKGERIRKIHIFAREDAPDRMYISEGSDILWVSVSLDPESDYNSDFFLTSYKYAGWGSLTTSRIYGSLRGTEKYFHSIKLIQDNWAGIDVDFKTSANTSWTNISDSFDTLPQEENELSSNHDTEGNWVQFRFRFERESNLTARSPVLISAVVKMLERLDSNDTYSYNVRLKSGYDITLDGQKETQTGTEKLTQLKAWIDDPLPLTLNSNSAFEDGKLVFIEPERSRMLIHKVDDNGSEVRIFNLTLIEAE